MFELLVVLPAPGNSGVGDRGRAEDEDQDCAPDPDRLLLLRLGSGVCAVSLGGLCVNFSVVGARRRAIDAILGGDSEILRLILAHIVEAWAGRLGADSLAALGLRS